MHVGLLRYGTEKEHKEFKEAWKKTGIKGQRRTLEVDDIVFQEKDQQKFVNFISKYHYPDYFEKGLAPEQIPFVRSLIKKFSGYEPLIVIGNPRPENARVYVLGYREEAKYIDGGEIL